MTQKESFEKIDDCCFGPSDADDRERRAWNNAIEAAAKVAELSKPIMVEQTGLVKRLAAMIRKLSK